MGYRDYDLNAHGRMEIPREDLGERLDTFVDWEVGRAQDFVQEQRQASRMSEMDAITGAQPQVQEMTDEELVDKGLQVVFDTWGPTKAAGLAMRGMKRARMGDLYHGTGNQQSKAAIKSRGFQQGESAELEVPGTSLSRDPLMSIENFGMNQNKNVLKVDVMDNPKEMYNLSPADYFSGKVPRDPVSGQPIGMYGKPNLPFNEAEIYATRGREGKNIPDVHAPRVASQAQVSGDNLSRAKLFARKRREKLIEDQGQPYIDQYGREQPTPEFSNRMAQTDEYVERLFEKNRNAVGIDSRMENRLFHGIKANQVDDYDQPYDIYRNITPNVKTRDLTAKESLKFTQAKKKAVEIREGLSVVNQRMQDVPYLVGDALTPRRKHMIKGLLKQNLKQLNSIREYKTKWSQSVEGGGGYVRMFTDVDTLRSMKRLGYPTRTLVHLRDTAGHVRKLDKRYRDLRKEVEGGDYIETIEGNFAEKEVREASKREINKVYSEYNKFRNKFMKDLNKLVGVDN